MRRLLTFGAVAVALTTGCGTGNEKPVIPTEIKQPPGPDTEGGKEKPKQPADGKGQQESKDG